MQKAHGAGNGRPFMISPLPKHEGQEKNIFSQNPAKTIRSTKTLNNAERTHLLKSLQLIKQKNLSLEELKEEIIEAEILEAHNRQKVEIDQEEDDKQARIAHVQNFIHLSGETGIPMNINV
jgi:hypothetical protein